MMVGTEYTLTGFDDFLERRRLVFVERLPFTRICGACGVVPNQSSLLPCGHVLCLACRGQIPKEGKQCPLDRWQFAEDDVVSLTFKQSDLEQHRVFCVAGRHNCNFAGKLCELKNHLRTCISDKVSCGKCQESVLRNVVVEHCRQCGTETAGRKKPTRPTAVAVEMLSEMKRDLERIREWAWSGKVDKDGVLNSTNSLVERMACLGRDLVQMDEEAGVDERDISFPTVDRTVASATPSYASWKPGVFIAMCVFTNVYTQYAKLRDDTKNNELWMEAATLARYTFHVKCVLKKEKSSMTTVSFLLRLYTNVWDDFVALPFFSKSAIIIRHPRDAGKDVRLPLVFPTNGVTVRNEEPFPEYIDDLVSTKTNWNDLEVQCFLHNENLYVNVVFE